MIQDIWPHQWDITYKEAKIEPDSWVLFFNAGKLLVIENQENTITFPTYDELKGTKFKKILSDKSQYLFELDKKAFFRVELSDEEAVHIIEVTGGKFEKRFYFRHVAPKEFVLAAITGFHLDGWYIKNRFCGSCASELVHDNKERMMRCPCCNNMVYPRINPAVIVAVTNGDKILLTKYRDREYKKYALIAGFTEIGESFEETVRREVMEEVGIKVKNIRYYKSQPWGFADNILAGYFCEVDGNDELIMDEDELSVAEWVEKSEIPVKEDGLSLTNEMIMTFMLDNK